MEFNSSFPYEGNEPYVFISYSHQDIERVMPILRRLNAEGFRIWYDDGIDPGTEWPESIAQHLSRSHVCMAFISQSSINSRNCRREINYALSKNMDFLYVVLEACEMSPGMEMQLSSYHALMSYMYSSAEPFFQRLLNLDVLQPCRRDRDAETASEPIRQAAEPASSLPAETVPEKKKRLVIGLTAVAATLLLAVFIFAVTRNRGSETEKHIPLESSNPASSTEELTDGISWSLNNGVLTLRGSGRMDDYGLVSESVPWDELRGSITAVIVEEGITQIGECSFSNCENIKSIRLPEGLREIGLDAFAGCSELKDIQFPDSLEAIATGAFAGTQLETVTIPQNVREIGPGAFHFTSKMCNIEVHENNQYFCSVDGILFSKDLTAILCYPAGRNEKAYSIPEGVARIGGTCFAGSCLEKVDIPDSVLTIETGAFELCGLKSIDLPPHLQTIGEAVIYATSIESVVIPASVQRIADNAFSVCSSLKSIDVEEGNVFYSSKEGVLFDAAKTTLCCYPAGKTTGEYVIPEGVTEIRRFAIAGCAFLTKVTLPDSLLSIGDNAFAYCDHLTEITIPDKVSMIAEDTFIQCGGLKSVAIPISVDLIENHAFIECFALSVVHYAGSRDQWESITIGEGNECLTGAEIIFGTDLPGQ